MVVQWFSPPFCGCCFAGGAGASSGCRAPDVWRDPGPGIWKWWRLGRREKSGESWVFFMVIQLVTWWFFHDFLRKMVVMKHGVLLVIFHDFNGDWMIFNGDIPFGFIKGGNWWFNTGNFGSNRKITELNTAFSLAMFDYPRVLVFHSNLNDDVQWWFTYWWIS